MASLRISQRGRRVASVLAVAACAGCGAQVLDVGSGGNGSTGSSTNGRSDPSAPAENDGGPDSWFPTTACTPVGPALKLVLQQDALEPRSLVADGDSVWFEGNDTTTSSIGVRGVYRVPVAGGAATPFPLASYSNRFGLWDGSVVYVRLDHDGSTEADPRRESLVLHDRTTHAEQVLPNPGQSTYVDGLHLHPTGVYWSSREYRGDRPIAISRFVPAGAPGAGPAMLTQLDNYSRIVTDGKDVFYVRYVRSGVGSPTTDIRIEAVPVAGGAPRVLRTIPYGNRFLAVIAVDAGELYFTDQETTDTGTILTGDIRALPKNATAGAPDRILTTGQTFSWDIRVDPDFVSWSERNAIVRVPRLGGPVERITMPTDTRYISSLAVDRCNLYWSVVNPPAIYARSRVVAP